MDTHLVHNKPVGEHQPQPASGTQSHSEDIHCISEAHLQLSRAPRSTPARLRSLACADFCAAGRRTEDTAFGFSEGAPRARMCAWALCVRLLCADEGGTIT